MLSVFLKEAIRFLGIQPWQRFTVSESKQVIELVDLTVDLSLNALASLAVALGTIILAFVTYKVLIESHPQSLCLGADDPWDIRVDISTDTFIRIIAT